MRKSKLIWLAILGLILSPLIARSEEDYWQQSVNYTITVTLDTKKHLLTGEEVILYKNNSPDTLRKIYFHLYPNAYKDNNTIYMKEARKFYFSKGIRPEEGGYIDITSFKVDIGSERTSNIPFIVDETILEAKLPQPLPPGREIKIKLSFIEKIRRHRGRAGYRGNQYDFGQWYPKVCVYDQEGWDLEQFHLWGEFYGEFGTFDVTITVPYEYIIGATGVVTQGDPGWEEVKVDTSLSDEEWNKKYREIKKAIKEKAKQLKTRTVTFHAERVHDFAWSACSDFLYERGEYEGTPIHVLYRAHNKKRWSKIVAERGRRTLEWLSAKFGRYPYPQLTIINGLMRGGMEYPMLVMNSSESESLILHEVGHIYFYGILANNEHKEAWLDEGGTEFQTHWYLETHYGKLGYNREERLRRAPWFVKKFYPLNSRRQSRENYTILYMTSGFDEPISKPAHEFRDISSYYVNAYFKGAFFFDMLRYIVGDQTWERICRTYFDRWRFKHVNEARFKAVCEEVSGMELDWFFDQWLHNTVLIDYALGRVKKKRLPDGSYKTTVEVLRKERGIMPVEILVETDQGENVIKRWDGREKRGTLEFITRGKPEVVRVDPNNRILDKNLLNNGVPRIEVYFDLPAMDYEPRDAYLVKWRPSLWYNQIDGLKPGAVIKGSYMGRYKDVRLGVWYGPLSRAVDFSVVWKNPTRVFTGGERAWYQLSFQKMEGRWMGDLSFSLRFSRSLTRPPFHDFQIGFDYSELRDPSYALLRYRVGKRTEEFQEWEPGAVNRLYLFYNLNTRGVNWLANLRLNLQTAQDFLGSDFNFNKVSGEVTLRDRNNTWRFRLFGGTTVRGARPPIQDMFFASGAGSRAKFQRFWLRSRGALPEEINYHLGGDGNLRGYYDHFIYGRRILAFNFEKRTRMRLPLLSRLMRSIRTNTTLVGFFDIGKVWDEANSWDLSDAGVGIRFNRRLFRRNYTLRVDFPLWLNRPLVGEKEVKFRWIVSFGEAF